MAKGRTTKPLRIVVHRDWIARDDVVALVNAGHSVSSYDGAGDVDLILHPAAHRWNDLFFDAEMLPIAVKAAQRRKTK